MQEQQQASRQDGAPQRSPSLKAMANFPESSGKDRNVVDRIQNLKQRLSGLHAGMEQHRNDRLQNVSHKLEVLEERLKSSQTSCSETFSRFSEQISQFQKDIDRKKLSLDKSIQEREYQTRQLEERLSAALQQEQTERQTAEEQLMRSFELKAVTLREEVLQSCRIKGEAEALLRQYCEVGSAYA